MTEPVLPLFLKLRFSDGRRTAINVDAIVGIMEKVSSDPVYNTEINLDDRGSVSAIYVQDTYDEIMNRLARMV